MKAYDIIQFLDEDIHIIIRQEVGDVLFGPLSSTLLDKSKKEIELKEYEKITDKEVKHVDYTKWRKICNITLEDNDGND